MSTRVNDVDPRDHQTRVDLRTQLVAVRHQRGISATTLAQALRTEASNVRRDERIGVVNARVVTIMRWADTLGYTLRWEPVGFPEPAPRARNTRDKDLDELLAAVMPALRGTDEIAVTGLVEVLARIRVACGITQARLAQVCGITESAVSAFENAINQPTLSLVQRHARGVAQLAGLPDAYLRVWLEPKHP